MHRQVAREALVLGGGGGMVVVLAREHTAARESWIAAHRCAAAWNELVAEAERRHARFWADRNRTAAESETPL